MPPAAEPRCCSSRSASRSRPRTSTRSPSTAAGPASSTSSKPSTKGADRDMHRTATREQWRTERIALLEREKELTRLTDEVARERQALPWVPVETDYVFETPDGRRTLAELFDGRSQLLVYHLMLGPGAGEGCPSCSSIADGINGPHVHLENHDVMFTAVSRAPLEEIEAYRARMGWSFR